MIIVRSQAGVPARLTGERWLHITAAHPELVDQRDQVLETLQAPFLIQEGDTGALLAVRFYEQTPLTSKRLVVVYKEEGPSDGFILTAYFTRRPSTRRVTIWMR